MGESIWRVSDRQMNIFKRKHIKCCSHVLHSHPGTMVSNTIILDTYSTSFIDALRESYVLKAPEVSWWMWEQDKKFSEVLDEISIVSKDNDNKYILIGPQSIINIDDHIEPIKWVMNSADSMFNIYFSINKRHQYYQPGSEYYIYTNIGFKSEDNFLAFKLRYYGMLENLNMKHRQHHW